MIRNKSFEIVQVNNDYMAVPTGKTAADYDGVVTLSESGAFLLRALDQERTVDELADLLTAEYEVDRERALRDITQIVKDFERLGLIEA